MSKTGFSPVQIYREKRCKSCRGLQLVQGRPSEDGDVYPSCLVGLLEFRAKETYSGELLKMKILKLNVAKTHTIPKGDEWLKESYEVEIELENPEEVEKARSDAVQLIDSWLFGKEATPQPSALNEVDPKHGFG